VRRTTLSFTEVIRPEVLRQAQAPIYPDAEQAGGRESFAPSNDDREPQDATNAFDTGSGTIRSDEDGVLVVISTALSQDHFDPYKMAIFASDDIGAAGLRMELRTWIDLASSELDVTREHLISDSDLFVNGISRWQA